MSEANAVVLKLPSFWPAHPEVWLAQAEAQFYVRGITADQTKYYYLVAALEQDVAGRMLDVLRNPPDDNQYDTLKTQLLATYGLTRRECASKLLDLPGFGDRKPSVLLSEMRALSHGHVSCMLFEEIFLRQMPDDIRMQLAQEDFSDLDALAARADALWHAKTQTFPSTGIHALTHTKTRTFRKDSPSIPVTPNNNATPSSDWCFYHAKFGAKARKCRPPCSYPGNVQAGRQ